MLVSNLDLKKEDIQEKKFNLVIVGYGGQGVITLANFVSQVAFSKNIEVSQAELHGLAQRGGSVQTFVRFGEKIYSPKVKQSSANLIIALDFLEAIRALKWANPEKTYLLTDLQTYWPYQNKPNLKNWQSEIRKRTKKIEEVSASEIVKKIGGTEKTTNLFMLGWAVRKKFLPFSKNEVWENIFKKIPKKYLALNQKIFETAFSYPEKNKKLKIF